MMTTDIWPFGGRMKEENGRKKGGGGLAEGGRGKAAWAHTKMGVRHCI